MTFTERAKTAFNALTGLHLYKKLPLGVDEMDDLGFFLNGHPFDTIFDVGANVGQSAAVLRKNFPDAAIHCFEPIRQTFEELKANTAKLDCRCHNLALGAESSTMEVEIGQNNEHSDMNSLLDRNANPLADSSCTEKIKVTTLSKFCGANGIERINYLKIDTEGFDLEVIKGADRLLEKHAIDLVEAEVSMNPYNTYHVPFAKVCSFLEGYDYVLFGLYEQTHEWLKRKPILRRSNALFISKRLADTVTTPW